MSMRFPVLLNVALLACVALTGCGGQPYRFVPASQADKILDSRHVIEGDIQPWTMTSSPLFAEIPWLR